MGGCYRGKEGALVGRLGHGSSRFSMVFHGLGVFRAIRVVQAMRIKLGFAERILILIWHLPALSCHLICSVILAWLGQSYDEPRKMQKADLEGS